MRGLITPLQFIDPEDLAVCDEVCAALEEWDTAQGDAGALAYLAARQFGEKWMVTMRNTSDDVCRERMTRALDALVYLDAAFIGENGYIYDIDDITGNGGKVESRYNQETGEVDRVLMFPYVDKSGAYVYQVARPRQ